MMMTEAAISGGLTRDLYAALGEELSDGSWAVRLYYKPFVRWIWYGGVLMALGGLCAPPDNANVWSNYNEYQAEAGFLSFFEADFRNALLNDTITVAKNTVTDGGGSERITRKVRLLTMTEVGLGNENGIAEGTKWPLFTDNNSRLAYPTAEAVSKSEYTSSNLNASSPWWWWLLTPYISFM